MRIYLELPEDTSPAYRARIGYVFRLFCAIYGHEPILNAADAVTRDACIRYLRPTFQDQFATANTVWLTPSYWARDPHEAAPPPLNYECNGHSTILHYRPSAAAAPDWLGEIFEWVSCADEYSVTRRDKVGRPLFSATYAGRHHIDTTIPYAALAMQSLQREICRVTHGSSEQPCGPRQAVHFIVPTHDVDYFPIGRMHAIDRLTRNAVISLLMLNRPALGLLQASMAARIALGHRFDPLDRITLLANEERRRGVRASYNFLVLHDHRLDAHYTLDHAGVVNTMRWLEEQGMEVGLHASYLCLDTPNGLVRELDHLHARSFYPRGGRQHWLRYTMARLIAAVEQAHFAYDTSIGWSDRLGFRAGACFAFPPYNFQQERAATFLEIPMVLMDQALPLRPHSPEHTFQQAAHILATSRSFGWGGISLLWHPAAFGQGWLPAEVGDTFWRLVDCREDWGDQWIMAADFLKAAQQRYVEVGLLPADTSFPAREGIAEQWTEAVAGEAPARHRERPLDPPVGLVGT